MPRGRLLRGALAALFAASGLIHLIRPAIFLPIMPPFLPPFLPYPIKLILLSGVAEIGGGAGPLFPPTRRAARYGLIALLVAVFPANIQMAIHGVTGGATPLVRALPLARPPLQPLLIWLVYRSDTPARAPAKSATPVWRCAPHIKVFCAFSHKLLTLSS